MKLPGDMEIDDNLLSKYLAGNASPEEAVLLEEWLSSDERNKIILKEYSEIWHFSSGNHLSIPTKEKAWKQLQQRLHGDSHKKIGLLKLTAGIAALFILFFCIAQLWKQNRIANNQNLIVHKVTNGIERDTLPEGSIAILRANTELSYLLTDFKKTRNMQFEGEAYFNIVHDESRPCEIRVQDIKIKVLGTSFNISTKDSGIVEVQLYKGRVLMYNSTNSLTLKNGQMGRYIRNERKFYLVDSIDINSIGYATKNFYFKDNSLLEISRYLEKAFGYHFEFNNQQLLSCRMTGQFENKPLSYIMDVIALTLNASYYIKQNTIYVSGDGCN